MRRSSTLAGATIPCNEHTMTVSHKSLRTLVVDGLIENSHPPRPPSLTRGVRWLLVMAQAEGRGAPPAQFLCLPTNSKTFGWSRLI